MRATEWMMGWKRTGKRTRGNSRRLAKRNQAAWWRRTSSCVVPSWTRLATRRQDARPLQRIMRGEKVSRGSCRLSRDRWEEGGPGSSRILSTTHSSDRTARGRAGFLANETRAMLNDSGGRGVFYCSERHRASTEFVESVARMR